jgi:hypothetical protein
MVAPANVDYDNPEKSARDILLWFKGNRAVVIRYLAGKVGVMAWI